MVKKTLVKTAIATSLLFLIFIPSQKALAETQAPIILNTALVETDSGWQISVDGLTKEENNVLIYINGNYDGLANISKNNNEFCNFSYNSSTSNPNSNLEIFAIAKNKSTGELSASTQRSVSSVIKKQNKETIQEKPETQKTITPKKVEEKIIKKLIAPTLISPTGKTDNKKPLVSGFSQNNSTVQIYIDEKLVAEIKIEKSSSESSLFEYSLEKEIELGDHKIYATAKKDGYLNSEKSNILSFSIIEPIIKEVKGEKIEAEEQNSSSTVSQETSTLEENTTKSKISTFNIVLFCIFIISIVIWIIAIGKELKKQPEKEQK